MWWLNYRHILIILKRTFTNFVYKNIIFKNSPIDYTGDLWASVHSPLWSWAADDGHVDVYARIILNGQQRLCVDTSRLYTTQSRQQTDTRHRQRHYSEVIDVPSRLKCWVRDTLVFSYINFTVAPLLQLTSTLSQPGPDCTEKHCSQ